MSGAETEARQREVQEQEKMTYQEAKQITILPPGSMVSLALLREWRCWWFGVPTPFGILTP